MLTLTVCRGDGTVLFFFLWVLVTCSISLLELLVDFSIRMFYFNKTFT